MQLAFVQHTLDKLTLQMFLSQFANAIARGKPTQCDCTVYKHEPSVHVNGIRRGAYPQVHTVLC